MRVELFGNKSLVRNVNVAIVGPCIEVLINSTERWPDAQRVGSSHLYIAQQDNDFSTHDCIAVSTGSEDNSFREECHIVLIPENDYEAEAIKGISYTNTEKDQVSILYVPRDFFKFKTLVGQG